MNKPRDIEEILDLCIERLRKGESLVTILADYPEHSEELKPHLSIAESLLKLPRSEPDASALHRTIFSMGAASVASKGGSYRPKRFSTIMAWAASIILLISISGYTTVNIAQASLPGDFLYPFKLATERVRLALIRSPEGEAEMRITLSERRLREVVATAERGQVYEAVLSAMLDEAQRALNNAEQLQTPVRDIMISRVKYLSGYQQDMLETLLPNVPVNEHKHFQGAIKQCRDRWNRCSEMGMRKGKGSQSSSQTTEEDKCGCAWCK